MAPSPPTGKQRILRVRRAVAAGAAAAFAGGWGVIAGAGASAGATSPEAKAAGVSTTGDATAVQSGSSASERLDDSAAESELPAVTTRQS